MAASSCLSFHKSLSNLLLRLNICRKNIREDTTGLDIVGHAHKLANSEFPCEKSMYMLYGCMANATTEIDYLAEQQCLCKGAFWDLRRGCSACRFAHGYLGPDTPEKAASGISSESAAYCGTTPPRQPFIYYLPTTIALEPITLGPDKFMNDTATSHYFTATQPATPGEITGSATARVQTFTGLVLDLTPTATAGVSDTGVSRTATASASPTSGAGAIELGRITYFLVAIGFGASFLY